MKNQSQKLMQRVLRSRDCPWERVVTDVVGLPVGEGEEKLWLFFSFPFWRTLAFLTV